MLSFYTPVRRLGCFSNSSPVSLFSSNGITVNLSASAKRYFQITRDDTLRFTARQNGQPVGVIVEGYVTNGVVVHKLIEIRDGGDIRVLDVPPRAPIVEYLLRTTHAEWI